MADAKFSRDEYLAMLKSENVTNEYVMAAVNMHLQALGKAAVTKISEVDLYLGDIMAIVRITPVSRSITPIDIARILTRLNLTAEQALERMQAYAVNKMSVIPDSLMKWNRSLIELEAALCGYTTLNNIPTSLIRNQMKREYPADAYGERAATGRGKVETVDAKAIRLRLNEVFGPHGIGWRVAAEGNVTLAHSAEYTERVSEENAKKGKVGRDMTQVRVFLAFGEYAVRDVFNGGMFYVRTNLIIDGWHMADFESAGSGAITAMTKEFARWSGAFDLSESTMQSLAQDD